MFTVNNPGANIARHFQKAKKAEEGETREWKGGKFRKQGGQWVPVTDEKKPKEEETGKEKKPSAEGGGMSMDKHEVAQMALMKEIKDSDPQKAYEIFQSLSPEAQSHVPQDVVNNLVKENHSPQKEGSDTWDNLGKDKSKKVKKSLETAEMTSNEALKILGLDETDPAAGK